MNIKKSIIVVLTASCLVIGCRPDPTSPKTSGTVIVSAKNVTETRDNMFVTGGWEGQPVYRVQMTEEESRVVHGLLKRMKAD